MTVRPDGPAVALMLGLLALAGCGEGAPAPSDEVASTPRVGPDDFAYQACDIEAPRGPCLIIEAGGKTVLVGVPEGALGALASADISDPDLVLTTRLHPGQFEGLMALRYGTWQAGRRNPLVIAGPEGLLQLAVHLDRGLEGLDAAAFLEDSPPGGFAAALLAPLEVPSGPGVRVFDSGDLVIDARALAGDGVSYLIVYDNYRLVVGPCGAQNPVPEGVYIDAILACDPAGHAFEMPDGAPVAFILQRGRAGGQ